MFKRLCAALILGLSFISAPALAGEEENAVAAAWLKYLDAGDYQGSWNNASTFWQNDHTLAFTVEVLGRLRSPLGKLKERRIRSFEFHPSPDGEVAYFTFDSNFENASDVMETVELLREKTGDWKVCSWAYREAQR